MNQARRKDKERRILASFATTYKPIWLSLVSGLGNTLANVIVKSTAYVGIPEMLFSRFFGSLLISLPWIVYRFDKKLFDKSSQPLLITRSILVFASLYLQLYAVVIMPIAEAALIMSTNIVWTTVFSRIILKERLDLLSALSIVSSLTGLVLMSRVISLIFQAPSAKYSDPYYWFGCLVSLACAILRALSVVCLRKLKEVDSVVVVLYDSVIGTIGSAIPLAVMWRVALPRCGVDGMNTMLIGILAFAENVSFALAMTFDKAGAVVTVRASSQVAMLFLFQVALFKDMPDIFSCLAVVFVLLSLLFAGLRKRRQHLRQKTKPRIQEADTRI